MDYICTVIITTRIQETLIYAKRNVSELSNFYVFSLQNFEIVTLDLTVLG